MGFHKICDNPAKSRYLLHIDAAELPYLLSVEEREVDCVSACGMDAIGALAIVKPAHQTVLAVCPFPQGFQLLLHIHGGDMQLLRGFRRGNRSLSAKPHKMPGKLLGTHIPGVSPGRIAHSIDTILYRIKNDWFGTDSFHLFHLALNLSPGREQSLPDGGVAGILPDGNLCRGQSVQIEQHHHLTVRLCQKSNLAVDGIQQRLAVVLAILFAVLMGKERKYLFRVSLVHYV